MFTPPSFLSVEESPDYNPLMSGEFSLKLGQIIKINYPDKTKTGTNKTITYDVFVNEFNMPGQKNYVIYDVAMANTFGGLAEYCEYTLRSNVEGSNGEQAVFSYDNNNKKYLGCMVIVAFINANPSDSIIIGGIPNFLSTSLNSSTYTPITKEDGHCLNFMFNGFNIKINKYGEMLLKKGGPTLADGNLNEEVETKPTTITIKKDGSIDIQIDSGKTLEIKEKESDATMTLGDGAKSAAIAEDLKSLYNKLLDQIKAITVPTGMGPSGTPLNAQLFPQWDDNIISKSLKVPK